MRMRAQHATASVHSFSSFFHGALRPQKPYGLLGTGEGWEAGRLYTYGYTVTTRMSPAKIGSDESHFNVSLIVRDKVIRQCPQTTTFFWREGTANVAEALLFISLTTYR